MGTFHIDGTLSVKNNLKLWSDAEGANIRFITANDSNKVYELDTNSGNLRLYYCTDGGTGASGYKSWLFNPDGSLTAAKFIGSLQGNADTATKLKTARTISLTGSVTGSGSFDGSGNLSIATTTNHTHSYLPLSGGTITATSTTDTPLRIQSGDTDSYICFNDKSGTILGYYGVNANKQPVFYYNGDNVFLHAGNYTNYTVTKTGTGASGTWPISITGNSAYAPGASKLYSTDSSYSYTSGNPYYGYLTYNSPYWDFKVSPASPDDVRVSAAYSDNNGYPITGYQKEHIQSINLTNSSYNVNTWYPVLVSIPYDGMRRIACAVQLNSGSVPSWSTHSGGFTRILEMLVTAGGWGTTSAASICLQDYSAFGGDQSVGYSQFTNSSRACFWCRGGGIYRLITDFEASWTVYTSSTTISSQTVAPTTSYPGVSFAKSRIYANLTGDSIYGAVWNDYAEYRSTTEAKPGEVIIENGDGTLHKSHSRLEPGANVITDTFGFAIGETDQTKTPIAVAGRALVYPYEDRYSYKPGAAVCSAPDGKISQMTREEMINYPDCIIGYVSEIPEYETWGTGNVNVDGRIWIKIK